MTEALSAGVPLEQGPYDRCLFVRDAGFQEFRALEGSHAGAEGTLQRTAACQIELSISPDPELLDDSDNPNRYWNRADAGDIHGDAVH